MKRILSSLLVLTMLLSCMSLSLVASATTEASEPEVYYYNDFNTDADLNDFKIQAEEGYAPEIRDGVLYFGPGTGGGAHIYTASPLLDFSSAETAPELVLEMRVKAHFGQTGYFDTWRGNTSNYKLKSVMLSKDGKLLRSEKDGTEIGTYDEGVYNTITIIYGNDSANPTRTIYLNGSKIADVSGTETDTYSANIYAETKKLTLDLLPYVTEKADYVQIDYIKISEKPTSMSAKLIAGTSDYAVVEFSSTPLNISEDNFLFSDDAEVASIDKINETTYRIMRTSEATEEYSVTISGVIDTLGTSISETSLTVVSGEGEYQEEHIYKEFQFEDKATEELEELKTATNSLAGGKYKKGNENDWTVTDGKLIVKDEKNTTNSNYMHIPKVEQLTGDTRNLIFEYKLLNNLDNKSYYLTDDNIVYTGDLRMIKLQKEQITWAEQTTNLSATSTYGTWNTYAIEYDDASSKRTLYIDGVKVAEDTTADVAGTKVSYWNTNNYGQFRFKLYANKSATANVQFEYIKSYSAATRFTAEIQNSEATDLNELIFKFNGIPMNVSATNIRVDGKVPASVTVYNEAEQTYKVVLSEKLKPETEYEVSLNGIYNTIGQTTYDVLPFTTRALEGNEVYFDISGSGVVRTAEGTVTNGSFAEAESLELTVKPNKGYEAVVTVNEEPVNATSYGKYVITVTDGAYIDIDFTAIADATAPTVSTASEAFIDGDTSYIFARISKPIENDKFGVIVSKDKAEPTIEDVNDVTTFKLSATNGSNLYGEYGIAITDRAEGNVLGNTYYVRPYATFGETVVYGDVVPVTVTTVQ